eukprot:26567-Eustigmatos_ZCMA.PRE.1
MVNAPKKRIRVVYTHTHISIPATSKDPHSTPDHIKYHMRGFTGAWEDVWWREGVRRLMRAWPKATQVELTEYTQHTASS